MADEVSLNGFRPHGATQTHGCLPQLLPSFHTHHPSSPTPNLPLPFKFSLPAVVESCTELDAAALHP